MTNWLAPLQRRQPDLFQYPLITLTLVAKARTFIMPSGWLTFILLVLIASHHADASISPVQENQSVSKVAQQAAENLDNYKRAAVEAQHKAEADPSETNLFLYASSLMKLDYHAAETIYRFAIGKFPVSVRLHVGLASALEAQSNLDEAAAELYRAAELAPADPHPLEFLVATEYIPQALFLKVVNGLYQLHQRYPQDGLILFDYEMVRSNRYTDKSQIPEDFVRILKEAIRLTPLLPEAYFQLSLVYEEQNAYVEEVRALRRAVQLSPQDEHYRYNLAMAYRQLGDKNAFLRELSLFEQLHHQLSGPKP
jgi:tetratricopeptide (TPR) repeat protein